MSITALRTISPKEAYETLQQEGAQAILLDVRSGSEFNSLHAEPAVNIPLDRLDASSAEKFKGKKVLCICQSGKRGEKAGELLAKSGLADVVNVEGGTAAWDLNNLPVVRGRGGISLERQVRIAAGLMVASFTLLGMFVSSYFLIIPLLVGSGLVFAGITDTCGLSVVLMKCPWNQG